MVRELSKGSEIIDLDGVLSKKQLLSDRGTRGEGIVQCDVLGFLTRELCGSIDDDLRADGG